MWAANLNAMQHWTQWFTEGIALQVVERCGAVDQLATSQAEYDHPSWLANAQTPVLVGGYIGFLLAYILALYTIFHVARAYKKLELKVCLHFHIVEIKLVAVMAS